MEQKIIAEASGYRMHAELHYRDMEIQKDIQKLYMK
jgi:hypothetical protein